MVGYDLSKGWKFQQEVIRKLNALPGVVAGSPAGAPPIPWGFADSVWLPGHEPSTAASAFIVGGNQVGPRYFETLGEGLEVIFKDGSTKVNEMNLHRYKRLLLAKRRELTAATSEREGLALAAEDARADLMDRATAENEVKVRIRLRQTEGHLLRAIYEALDRIQGGGFGVCDACKHPIASARLDAVPWTRLCRDCKEQRHLAA